MPDYDYACTNPDCDSEVERYFAMGRARERIPCQQCGGDMLRVYEPTPARFVLISDAKMERIKAGEPQHID